MRDLLYKNLISADKSRRVIVSSEVSDKDGVHSIVRRHFACMIRQVDKAEAQRPAPYLYVLKERNTKEKKERFFCKVKGSLLAVNNGKFYLLMFVHTLNIELTAIEKLTNQFI